MQVIIYTNSNGNVSVCTPSGEVPIEQVLKTDCPDYAIIVNNNDLPNEHYDFFNAWELADGQVIVNIDKATDITKNRLRAERTPLLTALDVQYQRALESGADTKVIVAEKQRLRDITQISVTTLNELKCIRAS